MKFRLLYPSFHQKFSSLGIAILIGHACLVTRLVAEDPVEIERFEKVEVAVGLIQPMEMAIAPDGKVFLIELSGTVKLMDPQSQTTKVVGKIEVTTAQENGLIGLALDPGFADNGWLYLQYSPPDYSGQYVSRFDFRNGQIDPTSEKRLFQYEEQRRECCHHAGSMEFGPDGNLYIGTGDNTNPFNDSEGFAPIDERPDREPWDAQRSSGNTKSYNGKILRIRPTPEGGYTIPDGNLFPKDGSVGHPEIYVMGCRNPWRLNIDQRTGILYWGDVGPDAGSDGPRGPKGYDEVNQARSAGNYGWPYFIGNNRAYSMVNFATGEIGPPQDPLHPFNRSKNNSGANQLPPAQPAMIYYPSGVSDEFPEVLTGGRTACAGPVYYDDPQRTATTRFPSAYDRTLFAFEWSRNWILAVHLDEQSNVSRLEPFLPHMKFVRPIDLQFDSHGSLYILEYGETWGVNADAKLVRLDYVRGNRTPIAMARASNNVGKEPLQVLLSAEGTMDKDRDRLSYEWRSVRTTGEGQVIRQVIGDTPELEALFDQPGSYTVELVVRDPHGAQSIMTLPVIVGNAAPRVRFVSPSDGDFFEPGEDIAYQLRIDDLEDGSSDAEAVDRGDYEAIESTAPSRIFVQASPMRGGPRGVAAQEPAGLAMIRKSDCLNCHAVDRPLVGPAFIEIANKYRDQVDGLDKSVQRVVQGSTGVWGKVAMLPHSQHSVDQVRQMVEYVYSVKADATAPTARGFRNTLPTSPGMVRVQLTANYTDLGFADIPAITGSASITLRSLHCQAEQADDYRGTQPLGSGRAEEGQFMGAIEHNGFLRFADVPFHSIQGLSVRVASAGAGGTIEIRRGSTDGRLLGTSPVEVNGDWEAFYDRSISLEPSQGRDDLYLVFKNEVNRGGLMNIDSITFRPR